MQQQVPQHWPHLQHTQPLLFVLLLLALLLHCWVLAALQPLTCQC